MRLAKIRVSSLACSNKNNLLFLILLVLQCGTDLSDNKEVQLSHSLPISITGWVSRSDVSREGFSEVLFE